MGRAKEIVMRVIPSTVANPFIRAHHYSGKVVNNSKLSWNSCTTAKTRTNMATANDRRLLIGGKNHVRKTRIGSN